MAKVRKVKGKLPPQPKGANVNDVLIKLIDAVYNLVNSGNIIGVLLLFVCVEIFYITQRLSSDALDKYVAQMFALDFFYLYPLSAVLLLSVATNIYQAQVYKKHIESLVQTRRELIHGLQTGEMKRLKTHNTSGIDPMEITDDC